MESSFGLTLKNGCVESLLTLVDGFDHLSQPRALFRNRTADGRLGAVSNIEPYVNHDTCGHLRVHKRGALMGHQARNPRNPGEMGATPGGLEAWSLEAADGDPGVPPSLIYRLAGTACVPTNQQMLSWLVGYRGRHPWRVVPAHRRWLRQLQTEVVGCLAP